MRNLSLIFFFLTGSLFAQEALDIETLPFLRTTQYSMAPYHHIVIYSAQRTGSSLIYNIFRYLFESPEGLFAPHTPFDLGGSVRKTHDRKNVKELGKRGVLYVVPIRNPMDTGISRYRTYQKEIKDIEQWCKRQIAKQVKYLKTIETLQKEGYKILIVKYEEFAKDCALLFQTIESQFSLSIAQEDKEKIEKGYAKENVSFQLTALKDFQDSFPLSGFHGEHIGPATYTPPEELLHWLHHYLKEEKASFRPYGY